MADDNDGDEFEFEYTKVPYIKYYVGFRESITPCISIAIITVRLGYILIEDYMFVFGERWGESEWLALSAASNSAVHVTSYTSAGIRHTDDHHNRLSLKARIH
ncbi:unnamed protein product [Oppiella nova]|uniref:Uncharacterized protein n=1 Tax=Oppiella nova TaxID=334625 RepID=A0A7R9QFQ5_9ACAR|nr:unnamed protein product [Oppiella nova]CAG2164449.1 unnamed protein product [Oppiella nova]